jgi:hypothetical protein
MGDGDPAVLNTYCRCAGRMIPVADCEPDCPQMAQLHAVAQAWRPRGLPVEQPPRKPTRIPPASDG